MAARVGGVYFSVSSRVPCNVDYKKLIVSHEYRRPNQESNRYRSSVYYFPIVQWFLELNFWFRSGKLPKCLEVSWFICAIGCITCQITRYALVLCHGPKILVQLSFTMN